jgi:N-acetylmuramoyl-L-alanine amidase
VVLVRSSDVFVELEDRAIRANRVKPDLFVSVHADSNRKGSVRGYTVFVARKASAASLAAAGALVGALRSTGLQDRGVRRANYRVLVKTTCPAVLVEMGFLSNREEAAMLRSAAFQQRIAAALAEGIRLSLLSR